LTGPVEQDVLEALVRDGKVKPDDLVWNAGMGTQWVKANIALPNLWQTGATPPPILNHIPSAEVAYQSPQTSPAALWRMILGILSLLCLGPITGIPAIICGHMARPYMMTSRARFYEDLKQGQQG